MEAQTSMPPPPLGFSGEVGGHKKEKQLLSEIEFHLLVRLGMYAQ